MGKKDNGELPKVADANVIAAVFVNDIINAQNDLGNNARSILSTHLEKFTPGSRQATDYALSFLVNYTSASGSVFRRAGITPICTTDEFRVAVIAKINSFLELDTDGQEQYLEAIQQGREWTTASFEPGRQSHF